MLFGKRRATVFAGFGLMGNRLRHFTGRNVAARDATMSFLSTGLFARATPFDGATFFLEAIRGRWFMGGGGVFLEGRELGPECLPLLQQGDDDLKQPVDQVLVGLESMLGRRDV
jgi:hypothetical protein